MEHCKPEDYAIFFPFHHVGIRPLMWANSFEYHVSLECHVLLESKMRHIFDIDAVADRDFDNQNKNRISICCLILSWKQMKSMYLGSSNIGSSSLSSIHMFVVVFDFFIKKCVTSVVLAKFSPVE